MKSKILIRLIAALLLVVMLVPAFASCADESEEGKDGETTLDNGEVSTDGAEEDSAEYPYKPYKEDFGGYELRVLQQGGSSSWVNDDILGDYMGSTILRAAAVRNEKVMSKYNFTINCSKEAAYGTIANNTGSAGEDAYDMWTFRLRDMLNMGLQGYMCDLRSIESMHTEDSWYDQTAKKTLTYGDFLFYITGDLLWTDDDNAGAMVFKYDEFYNGKYDEIYGKDLYQLVRDGEWTFEKLKVITEKATVDNDGDGAYDVGDSIGFAHENNTMLALNVGLGNVAVTKDINDTFVVNTSEKQITAFQDILHFLNGPSFLKNGPEGANAFIQYVWIAMLGGNVYGDYGEYLDFGIIPYPKWDTAQQEYYSFVGTHGCPGIAIPKAVGDPERAGSIIDVWSFESQKTVVPAYISFLFEDKVVQRPDDVEMLKLALKNQVIEPANLWAESGMSYYNDMKARLNSPSGDTYNDDIASTIKGAADKVKAKNKEWLDAIKKFY